jgi:hypothetical protein
VMPAPEQAAMKPRRSRRGFVAALVVMGERIAGRLHAAEAVRLQSRRRGLTAFEPKCDGDNLEEIETEGFPLPEPSA